MIYRIYAIIYALAFLFSIVFIADAKERWGDLKLECIGQTERVQQPLANIIVWVSRFDDKADIPVHESLKEDSPDIPTISVQPNAEEMPHLILRVNQRFRLYNNGSFALNPGHKGRRNLGWSHSLPVGQTVEYRFREPEVAPFEISSGNDVLLHAFVPSHPYAAITDSTGIARFSKLPTGKLTFAVWRPDVGRRMESLVVTVHTESARLIFDMAPK